MSTSAGEEGTRALQRALAAEHAAVWGYGVVGGHLPTPGQPMAQSADQSHRSRRDALTALVRARGDNPVAAAPAYQLPFPVSDALSARRLAAGLEMGAAAGWRGVLGAVPDQAVRRLALAALTEAATRGLQWRLTVPGEPTSVPFPGT